MSEYVKNDRLSHTYAVAKTVLAVDASEEFLWVSDYSSNQIDFDLILIWIWLFWALIQTQ